MSSSLSTTSRLALSLARRSVTSSNKIYNWSNSTSRVLQQRRHFLETTAAAQSSPAASAATSAGFEYDVDEYDLTGPAPPKRMFLRTSFDLPDPSKAASEDRYGKNPLQLTKIVATIGPTSEQLPVLEQVVKQGMRIMRLNFSHASVEEVELRTKNLSLLQVNI